MTVSEINFKVKPNNGYLIKLDRVNRKLNSTSKKTVYNLDSTQ